MNAIIIIPIMISSRNYTHSFSSSSGVIQTRPSKKGVIWTRPGKKENKGVIWTRP